MKLKQCVRITLLYTLIILIFDARAEFVVSPVSPNDGSGNYGALFVTQLQAPSMRYQELRRADEFSSFGSPILITEFSLWRNPRSLPIDFTLPNVSIRFSTSVRSPSDISFTFEENIGADEVTVFSGSLHLVDTGGEYGIRIPLQTPFLYDPSQGSLLMDFWNYQTVPTPANGSYFVNFARTPFSQAWFAGAANAAAPSASTTSVGSLFTRFTVTPVPEPSTWLLLAAGIAALAFARRKWNQTL